MSASTVEVLIPLWESILQRSPVSPQDNFFDLGGTLASAEILFARMAEICGRELPAMTICYAPTIAALAGILNKPVLKPLHPLVLLKPGAIGAPIFIAHGIGGSVLDIAKLARTIRSQQPVYGMQLQGMDGIEEPSDRIEEMAQRFLDALQNIQARGPYFLIGYSLGGLITLEIAQRLHAKGEKIALLAMLDSYPDKRHLSFKQRTGLNWRLAKRKAAATFRSVVRREPSHTVSAAARIRRLSSSPLMRAMENVCQSSYFALRRYQPRFYQGKINFIRAEVSTSFPDDPIPVWSHLADNLQVETVAGTHVEMLTTSCESVAYSITRYLEEATTKYDR